MKKRKDAKNITKSVSKKLFACLISRDILISKCFVWITLPDFDTTDIKRQNRIIVEFIDKFRKYL